MIKEHLVVVRGGGDLATGTIHKLHRCGFPVIVLETAHPSAVRRQVAFSEAVVEGQWCVEGVTAVRTDSVEEAFRQIDAGRVPVLVDEQAACLEKLHPAVLVDAILAKKNLGTKITMAETVIALGPGFTAQEDAHLVIETRRGHNLGRVIFEGRAEENTGVPGIIGGYGKERVIHAPSAGILHPVVEIGALIEGGELMAKIDETPVYATISGVVRGMLREGYPVTQGLKMADIDPRKSEQKNCFTISDKARCIAGSVLEVILMRCNRGEAK